MEHLQVAKEAAQRWQERLREREAKQEKVKAGKAVEADESARVQLRLERLSNIAQVPNRDRALLESFKAAPGGELRLLRQSVGLERVIGKRDFLDANFLEIGLAVARFVGRVNIGSASGSSLGFGTGFMVSPRLLMTNHHVLGSIGEARTSQVEFDYQNDRHGNLLPTVRFSLEPETFFMTDQKLDFTLVAVRELSEGKASLKRYGWIRLIGSEGKAVLGESLNIIQHPHGEPKQLVLRSNELVDLFAHYAHYVGDTDPGASGSAAFNDQWELVALHHAGVPKTDSNGNLIGKDNTIWRDGMDPDALQWVANEGIRVSSLVEHIKTQPLPPAQDRLRDELLHLDPPSAIETAIAAQDHALTAVVAAPGLAASARAAVATSFTLPLTISVQLGAAAPLSIALQGALASPAGAPAPDGLREALAALESSKTRVYYDASADLVDKETYYGRFEPDGNPGQAYAALSALLARTHRTRLSYGPSRHVYPWVDLHDTTPQPSLRSIYSGKTFSAAEFIEHDFAIDRQREVLRESIKQSGSLGSEASLASDDFLEASLPYNCEHVVPQSWFAKKEPMRGDLHHLFACESECNSFRSNIPYFDFTDFGEAVRSDCGKREEGKFEPGAGKGTVARATLYFLLRYPGQINRSAREYTAERIGVLLAWHKQFPPALYELHRNAAIYAVQGNRNPLIDFPAWAPEIDFERGLG
jgi:endonuclease G